MKSVILTRCYSDYLEMVGPQWHYAICNQFVDRLLSGKPDKIRASVCLVRPKGTKGWRRAYRHSVNIYVGREGHFSYANARRRLTEAGIVHDSKFWFKLEAL